MRASLSIVAFVLLAVASSCSSNSSAKGGDASSTTDVGQTSDVGLISDVVLIVPPAPDAPADAPVVPPDNVRFPSAPEVSCGGDATECPLPPSACADPSCDAGAGCPGLQWVVYYDNPACENGSCVYTNRYFQCSLSSACSVGGCRFSGTTAAP